MISQRELDEAIAAIEDSKRSHLLWIEHLAECPDCPDARVAGGTADHVKSVAKYEQVLGVLRAVGEQLAA